MVKRSKQKELELRELSCDKWIENPFILLARFLIIPKQKKSIKQKRNLWFTLNVINITLNF